MAKATPKKKAPKKKGAPRTKWYYIKRFWIIFGAGIGLLILIFLLASWGAFGDMPKFEELENPEKNLATQIISSDGKIIGTFFNENRTPVTFEEIPEHLIQALVATEDERYFEHSGIDARGTIRAFAFAGSKGGASTITQQLSKLLFTGGSKNIVQRLLQKIKEWVIAARLERQYTKEEIITMYLNKFDFLFQAVGVESASRIYFGKNTKDLKLEEAAVLVAMLKNPRQFNPYREISKKKSLSRRNIVFGQMAKNGFLTEVERDSLQEMPMKLNFSPEGHADGIATYFREYLRDFMDQWIKKNPKGENADGETEYFNIYRDGLRINVTIDSRMQRYAEKAVQQHLSHLQKEFDRQNKSNKIKPFRDIEKEDINRLVKNAMRR